MGSVKWGMQLLPSRRRDTIAQAICCRDENWSLQQTSIAPSDHFGKISSVTAVLRFDENSSLYD